MKYLLDTNICIYLIKRRPSSVIDRIRKEDMDAIAISAVTLAELHYGVARSRYPEQNRIALLEFMVPFRILDFDQDAAVAYGKIRAQLESVGTPIGPMDLLLAAQALSQDLILVTNDEKEFRRVRNLNLENWADP
jgi:tRNA(fMet)-specific endonuclease VapC